MKTTVRFTRFLSLCVFFLGCAKGGDNGGGPAQVAAVIPPAQLCAANAYATWDAQRACLVGGYQTQINNCLAVTDAIQRANCLSLVSTAYVGANNGSAAWGGNWLNYKTALDPYYQSLAVYNAQWSQLYAADVWSTYYQNAVALNYYNQIYVANYNQAYLNYWARYGY